MMKQTKHTDRLSFFDSISLVKRVFVVSRFREWSEHIFQKAALEMAQKANHEIDMVRKKGSNKYTMHTMQNWL